MTKKRKNVLLFGFYFWSNFGDDLMAWLLSKYISELGYQVILLASRKVTWLNDISSVIVVDEFQKTIEYEWDFAVYGGGGLLVEEAHDKFVLSYFKEIADEIKKRKSRFVISSIGGGDLSSWNKLDPIIQYLLNSAQLITVRNKSDLWISGFLNNTKVEFYPDILWNVGRFMNFQCVDKFKSKKTSVVSVEKITLSPRWEKIFSIFIKCIFKIAKTNIIVLERWTDCHRPAEMVFSKEANVTRADFSDLILSINYIINSKFVISSKLHIGLVAMALGIPFISFQGLSKTAVMMREVGFDRWLVPRDNRWKLIPVIISSLFFIDYSKEKVKIAEAIQFANGHLEGLRCELESA